VNTLQAVVLGVVEGLTEFVPVSSTAHLLVAEHLMGLPTDTQQQKDALIGFTAVIQTGAILAAVLYFLRDIVGLAGAFLGGLVSGGRRQTRDFRFALAVLIGSLPIGLVGFALKDQIKEMDTHLAVVGAALVLFSAVFVVAERSAKQDRPERDLTVLDGLVIGLGQCLALVPGVSRSGATISAGLLRGLDRVSATRLSFLLGIPALLAAGLLGLKDATDSSQSTHNTVGAGPTLVATVVAFVVAYASIWGLLRFVSSHRITAFVPYRVVLGVAVLVAAVVG
jgi:undecaprenyl-diphosphatase